MATIDSYRKDLIRMDNPSSDFTKFIEWNVDMNVNVPNSAGSKFLRQLRWIVVLFSFLMLLFVLWQIKNEVQHMRLKVYDMNQNYKSLQWKHNKLNFQLINLFRTIEKNQNVGCNCLEMSKQIQQHSETISKIVNCLKESSLSTEFENKGRSESPMDYSDREEDEEEPTRTRRSVNPPALKRNVSVVQLETNNKGDQIDNYRSARMRRDEGRGKKRTKKKRRPKRSRRQLGPLTATFLGAVPEQHVIDSAHIGPWVRSYKNESKYSFNKFHLVDDRKAIEVTVDGLYMISAQIYYFGEFTHHSYWILLNAEGASASQKLVKCAAVSALSDREVSCYTSVVLTLNKGDRVYLQQQERNRLINLREGYSYVQFVLLSTDFKRRF